MCVLLAASADTGRALWHRHRDRARVALGTVWSGARQGRHPAALLLWVLLNATDGDPYDAYALVTSRRADPDPWVRAMARYVMAYGALGEDDAPRARRALRTATDTFRTLGDRWGTALAQDALAGLATARGDRAAAVALIDQALGLTEQLDATADTADLLVSRGDNLAGTDSAAAREAYTRAAGLARRTGSPAGLAVARRGLGDLALAAGEPAVAEGLYREALAGLDARWVRSVGHRVRTLAGLARVHEARGDRQTARLWYRQAAAAVSLPGASAPAVLALLGLPEEVRRAIDGA
ncbi:hypothetical protein ACWC2T_41110 [Streptomyces sp. NPDC001393]